MILPVKHHLENHQKAKKGVTNRRISGGRMSGRYFRLVVPALVGYPPDWDWADPAIIALRAHTVDDLVLNQSSRGLSDYLVAVERHAGSGRPHLDILLVYKTRVMNSTSRYDYLVKHGSLMRYRTLNRAILEYGRKQDPAPLGDMDTSAVLMESRARTDLYPMMQKAMLSSPFQFDPIDWLSDNGLMAAAVKVNMYKIIRAIRDVQHRQCNRLLRRKPGIRQITPELISERLTADQHQLFSSWKGYQTIVNHINQISKYGFSRPHKTKNLFLAGPPDTGKSSLIIALQRHCPAYPLGTRGGWFPSFESGVYTLLSWDEFSLKCYPYPDLLKLLEGRPMKLPQKGGHVPRDDNQLVIATTNLTMAMHVRDRFKLQDNRAHALLNLSARFTEVIVPADRPLFILNRLIVQK